MKHTDQEYFEFCIREALQEVSRGLLIYVVALGAFWLTIG